MGDVYVAIGGGGGVSSDEVTATKDKVLAGYTAVTADSDDEPGTGTMVNRGAWGSALGINDSVTIPQGYHSGSGKVTQSIPTFGGQTIAPSASQQTVSCAGKYATGNVTVSPVTLPAASDIRQGVNVYGRIGTMPDYSYLATGHTAFKNSSLQKGVLEGGLLTFTGYSQGQTRREYAGGVLSVSSSSNVNSSWIQNRYSFNATPFNRIRVKGVISSNYSNDALALTLYTYSKTKGWEATSKAVDFTNIYVPGSYLSFNEYVSLKDINEEAVFRVEAGRGSSAGGWFMTLTIEEIEFLT